ncbi:uncharacterized protein LOC131244034 [Magnolia sinica]|uniref:uncharacterized protein LOC131244034 n=1 Tax=Magnolia sinica TaxID=86752 RepID=UPI0026595C9C|nr:uncharacterized protein LOC131244034 [Magnolia sinica]
MPIGAADVSVMMVGVRALFKTSVILVVNSRIESERLDVSPEEFGLSKFAMNGAHANKLYIGGLLADVLSEILLNFFSRHGEIEEGFIAYDKETNKSRGFGFVTYKTLKAAKKALDDPNKLDMHSPGRRMSSAQPLFVTLHTLRLWEQTLLLTQASLLSTHRKVSYAQVAAKKDRVGLPAGVVLPAGAPAGISGYPYYATK